MKHLRFFLPTAWILHRYIEAGLSFGKSAMTQPPQLSRDAFLEHFLNWEFWETECVRRGYQPYALDTFLRSEPGSHLSLYDALKQIPVDQDPVPASHQYRQQLLSNGTTVNDLERISYAIGIPGVVYEQGKEQHP